MIRIFYTAVVLAVGILCNGCFLWTTRDDGESLKQEVQHVKDRLVKVEDDLGKKQAHLSEMIERARQEVENLEDTLNKATKVLARNSADFGAEMEGIRDKLMVSEGSLAELQHALGQMQTEVNDAKKKVVDFALAAGLDLPVDESTVPKAAKDHLSAIKGSYSAGRYGEVRSLSKLYLSRYPRDKKCEEVQVIIARSYIAQKRYAKALGALRRFTDLYPKSTHMPEVLYEMAHGFYRLGDCTDARILVDSLMTRYKDSSFATKANKLKATMDGPRNLCSS